VENNMRYNKNRNKGPMKRKQKKTLDEHDLLIETRLCGRFGERGQSVNVSAFRRTLRNPNYIVPPAPKKKPSEPLADKPQDKASAAISAHFVR
jgi:hypothetical protein